MTDAARAEITNGIWLCRNCHKLIDTDDLKYTSDVLFAWREQHEKYIISEMGSTTDQIIFHEKNIKLIQFKNYPPIIRRIIIDAPAGWEWRLAAELMRHLNGPYLRKIKDLRDGLYIQPQKHLCGEEFIDWLQAYFAEGSSLIESLINLIDRLNNSWGPPGEPGDVEEIHHMACLFRDYLEQVVKYEETIYFTNVPDEYLNLIRLCRDVVGSQVMKLSEIPDYLDEAVRLIGADHGGTVEHPKILTKEIIISVPENWEKEIAVEIKKLRRYQTRRSGETGCLCLSFLIVAFIVWFAIVIR